MFDYLVRAAVRGRVLVLMALVGILAYGAYAYREMPVDAFPDISPIMVPVFAEAHGMAPEEVERLITYPIEATMNGLPGVKQIKSTSAFGMAVIYVYFGDDVDIYFARQLVAERLAGAMNELPEMHDPPTLGPISTGLGQVFLYYLTLDPGTDTGGKDRNTYLREVNDWIVKFQLQTVPGVTEILSMGGHVLQYQIRVDPDALLSYDVDLDTIIETVRANNRNVGGQFLVTGAEEYLVRGLGLLGALDEIRAIHLKTVSGVPVTIGDVAEVAYGNEIRRGAVSRNGEGEVVSGIVLKLYGENTSHVIENLYAKVGDLKANLPAGVHLEPYYEQAELVENATSTVKNALLIGALLVVITLAVFLGNIRTAFIVTMALPVCALIAVIGMSWRGISANLMSLGGIAIAIGMLGDGAIVMVENIYRHLRGKRAQEEPRDVIIVDAAREVARPIVFSIAIIVMVFLPLFTLEGIEGKMFSPMAFTISFALAGSILAALLMVPALSHFLLRPKETGEIALVRGLKAIYRPVLRLALAWPKAVIGGALAVMVATLAIVPLLGTEFIPTLEEGSIFIRRCGKSSPGSADRRRAATRTRSTTRKSTSNSSPCPRGRSSTPRPNWWRRCPRISGASPVSSSTSPNPSRTPSTSFYPVSRRSSRSRSTVRIWARCASWPRTSRVRSRASPAWSISRPSGATGSRRCRSRSIARPAPGSVSTPRKSSRSWNWRWAAKSSTPSTWAPDASGSTCATGRTGATTRRRSSVFSSRRRMVPGSRWDRWPP